ncbi:hypothetical protein ABOZ73_08875 [Caulobacter sp. 73W]|uniref:S-layer protein n=1 Tax=Caulobacter sp. 73W TaxID=3161137 RepID=A0AB39KY30_9CAUL
MATIAQLEAAYTAITRLTPSTAQSLILQDLAIRSQNGVITDDQAYAYIIGQAQSTTSVAALSYQFFTGKIPTSAGFDYLVNSATNTSDLNDPAYQAFNLENRYINFAINLGVVGEGRTNFLATFGGLSFADTVAVAYNRIIGNAQATAAKIDVNAAIANIAGRKAYFDAVVAQAGITAADRDLAAKAAVVGYIMAEATKAQVGIYSNGLNNFYLDLAPDAKANYNVDLNTYVDNGGGDGGAGTPGETKAIAADGSYTGTGQNDTVTGTIQAAAADVTISLGNGADSVTAKIDASAAALTTTVDLGAGNDTFNAAVTGGAGTGATTINAGAGNDTVTATYTQGAAVTTFNGGDGNDTLKLSLAADTTAALTKVSAFETIELTATAAGVDVAADNFKAASGGTAAIWQAGAAQAINVTGIVEGVNVGSKAAGAATFTYANADDATVTVSGSVGALVIGGVSDTVNLTASKNSTIATGITVSADVLKLTGTSEIAANTVVFNGAGDVSHTIDASTLGASTLITYVTASGADGLDTVKLTASADVLNLTAGSVNSATITLGGGADTVVLGDATVAANYSWDGTALKTFTQITDFSRGSDKIDVTGTYKAATNVIGVSDLKAYIEQAGTGIDAQVGAGEWTVFTFGSHSYIFAEDAGNQKTLVQLTGVTGVTGGANNTFDVY